MKAIDTALPKDQPNAPANPNGNAVANVPPNEAPNVAAAAQPVEGPNGAANVGPASPNGQQPQPDRELFGDALEKDIMSREELHITKIDCQHFPELGDWFAPLAAKFEADIRESEADAAAIALKVPPKPQPAAPPPTDGQAAPDGGAAGAAPPAEANPDGAEPPAAATDPAAPPAGPAPAADGTTSVESSATGEAAATGSTIEGPKGPGWVVELQGYHYHNDQQGFETAAFVRKTLLKNLREGFVQLPDPQTGRLRDVSFAEMGISHPILVFDFKVENEPVQSGDPAAMYDQAAADANRRTNGDEEEEKEKKPEFEVITLKSYRFFVQFAWKPTPPSEREKKRAEAEAAAQQNVIGQPPI
jgi:type IV pilus assembly protein PilM